MPQNNLQEEMFLLNRWAHVWYNDWWAVNWNQSRHCTL